MTVLSIAKAGPSQGERAESVADDIKLLIYDRLDGMPLAMAVGVLEIVKSELILEATQ